MELQCGPFKSHPNTLQVSRSKILSGREFFKMNFGAGKEDPGAHLRTNTFYPGVRNLTRGEEESGIESFNNWILLKL